MNRRITLAAVASIVGLGMLGAVHSAHALTVIPTYFEKNTDANQTITTSALLFNESTVTANVSTSVANFTTSDENGTPSFGSEADLEDLAGWITVDKGPFTLLPGQRLEVPVTIKVPANADPGGHYASVFFNQQGTAANGSGVTVNVRLGMNILLRVNGDVNESARLASFTSKSGSNHFDHLPVDFSARFINDGNIHIRPIGTLTVRNLFGGTTAVVPFNTTQGAVLPNSARRFDVAWEKKSPSGSSSFFQEIKNEWTNFALGPYTATLSVTYGSLSSKTLTGSYSFVVFPWRVMTIGVIALILIVWLIIFLVKRYNHWIVLRASRVSQPSTPVQPKQTKNGK